MTSKIHSILPRIAIWSLLLVPVAGFALYRSWMGVYTVPRNGDMFTLMRGTWAWSRPDSACRTNPFRIGFSTNHRTMTLTAERPYKLPNGVMDSVATYEVLQITRSSIRVVLRGETRVTADSQPVVWDLILKSPDSYTWHRTDWGSWMHTPPVHRCVARLPGDSL